MKQPEMNLDAPVAGMSLTAELGARPWQKPPQYNTVDQAVDYYITRLNTEDVSEQVIDVEYKSGEEELDDKTKKRLSDRALSKFKTQMLEKNDEGISVENNESTVQEEPIVESKSPELPSGLMSRRIT